MQEQSKLDALHNVSAFIGLTVSVTHYHKCTQSSEISSSFGATETSNDMLLSLRFLKW